MKKIFLLLAIILAVRQLPAQPPDDSGYAPLFVFTEGPGQIYPAYDGEMLRVGHVYAMRAVPARGYKFASWQPVNVISSTIVEEDQNGNLVTNEEVQTFPVNQYVMHRELTFRVQPAETISPGTNGSITESYGWQANFVPWNQPVPKPPRNEILDNGL